MKKKSEFEKAAINSANAMKRFQERFLKKEKKAAKDELVKMCNEPEPINSFPTRVEEQVKYDPENHRITVHRRRYDKEFELQEVTGWEFLDVVLRKLQDYQRHSMKEVSVEIITNVSAIFFRTRTPSMTINEFRISHSGYVSFLHGCADPQSTEHNYMQNILIKYMNSTSDIYLCQTNR